MLPISSALREDIPITSDQHLPARSHCGLFVHFINSLIMETYDVTLTDTFGGEANYSWVHREEIQVKTSNNIRVLTREARAAVGMTGVRASMFTDYGDVIQIDFSAQCVVLFITPKAETT